MMEQLLKPCPFCGKVPTWWSCDRLIKISCEDCGYQRTFKGIVNEVPNNYSVIYEGGEVSTTEFVHTEARREAIEAWNKRVEG